MEEKKTNGHHLILGELTDYITGNTVTDTHDERYRQKISHLLVDSLGFKKTDIETAGKRIIQADTKKAELKIDFIITIHNKICMVIKYAPGSLVTRRQCTLGWSRIITRYQVPVVVITNGEDAEIMDGKTGKITGSGLENIPSRDTLENAFDSYDFKPIPEIKRSMAFRIVYAMEVDGSCPCDTDICRIE
jgi:hypothetical protein